MGYRIQYGETVKKEVLTETTRNRKPLIGVIAGLIICCVFTFIISKNADKLADFILPGNREVTKNAISAFTEDLREGESVSNAFAAFCKEIIENANIPD